MEINLDLTAIEDVEELCSVIDDLKDSRATLLNDNAALEKHLQCRKKNVEHDRKMLEVMRKGLDVPFSRIQEKSHRGTG